MKTKLVALVTLSAVTTGCMGTAPKPVAPYQYGDDKKTCEMLQAEVSDCESQMAALEKKRKGKVGGNIFIGSLGAVLFWPALFFLDTKSDEQAEIEALQKRRQSLGNIAIDNGCEWCVGRDFSIRNEAADKASNPNDGNDVSIPTMGSK